MHNATVDRVLQSVAADVCVDRATLATLLADRPGTDAVVPLLSVPAAPVVRAAVLYLGLYGTIRESPLLVLCLQHKDSGVARLAEQCLWGLWMQAGTERGNRSLAAALDCIKRGEYTTAENALRKLLAEEPTYAEAQFQHGVALSMLDQPVAAATAYRETLRLNPYHFGAAAALGHASLELGDLPGALHHYRRALRIHPRLEDVGEALQHIEDLVEPRGERN
jgi:tetratricopeptide (TPR) repeat protein